MWRGAIPGHKGLTFKGAMEVRRFVVVAHVSDAGAAVSRPETLESAVRMKSSSPTSSRNLANA